MLGWLKIGTFRTPLFLFFFHFLLKNPDQVAIIKIEDKNPADLHPPSLGRKDVKIYGESCWGYRAWDFGDNPFLFDRNKNLIYYDKPTSKTDA